MFLATLALMVVASVFAACGAAEHPASAGDLEQRTPPPVTAAGVGAAALPSPLRIVGVGDSVTSAANCACAGFISDYAELVHARYGVPVQQAEYGVGGATTKSLLPLLSTSTATGRAVERADVVSVTIGANDLYDARRLYDAGTCGGSSNLACFVGAIETMRRGLDTDLDAIGRLTSGRRVQVLVNDYWNVFQDGAVANKAYGAQFGRDSDTVSRQANVAICAEAKEHGYACVDTYTPFEGTGDKDPTGFLESDGDHPNAKGHELIAKAMLAVGLPALHVASSAPGRDG